MVREKYLKLHLGDESRSEDVGLDTYGILGALTFLPVVSEIGSTQGVDSWFSIVSHVWTSLPESDVCSLKHRFALLTGSVEIVLWDFCA